MKNIQESKRKLSKRVLHIIFNISLCESYVFQNQCLTQNEYSIGIYWKMN